MTTILFIEIQRLFYQTLSKLKNLFLTQLGPAQELFGRPEEHRVTFHVNYYNALDAADYLIYDWNVSAGDAAAPRVPADQLVHNIESQVPGKSRIIILMHDAAAKVTTVDALPRIIKYLKQQGYSFGVITPKVAPVLFPGGFNG